MELFTASGLTTLLEVIGIDLVLAGDNAVVIGLAAAGLPAELRSRAILFGILAATVLRIGLALFATWVMGIPGVILAGGLLLSWVCWKMYRELRSGDSADEHPDAAPPPTKTFGQAALQIVLADVSMSLDNVLAVAGAAREHPTVLVIGLVFSIALMGLAASFIARLLHRHRWIAYMGLGIIVYVAATMLWQGAQEFWPQLQAMLAR
ncbi:TerC family protein [Paracoccus sulfuroxidans]|uniref:YjbE family integral membrane protein n=1 Tax=Paracoccus sulfuroxidans TaxID=384678 RepID=A0A562NUJ8_9RHOB|nr:TerC family protein [Paracoccus sulfuroxidans]TWI35835.1 YjbE family integral membrane protein [Paracoccus sulfuroxidans]